MNAKSRMSSNLGEAIRDARNQRGWSQLTLGERAGVSRPTIARVEAGGDVSTATVDKVVGALRLTIKVESAT